MFTLLNSIPIQIRIITLFICEIILIFFFVKYKQKFNKPFKSFFLLIIVFAPLFIISTILLEFKNNFIQSVSPNFIEMFPVLIGAIFGIGLIITAIAQLRDGKLPQEQKNGLLMGLFIITFGVLGFFLVEIFE